MQMLIAGDWVDTSDKIPVLNPFDNTEVDTVAQGHSRRHRSRAGLCGQRGQDDAQNLGLQAL